MLHFFSSSLKIQCAVLRLVVFYISSSTTVFLAFALVSKPLAGVECDTKSQHGFGFGSDKFIFQLGSDKLQIIAAN